MLGSPPGVAPRPVRSRVRVEAARPRQRRRRALVSSGRRPSQTVAVGVATETDVGIAINASIPVGVATETNSSPVIVPGYDRTFTVGVATETDSASSAANASSTAQGGLAFLFSSVADQTIAIGVAAETDTAPSIGIVNLQTITVGTATEIDEARSVGPLGDGTGYHWLRRRRNMTDLKKSYFALLPSAARTTAYQSAILKAEREAGVMVFLDVTSASGSGGLALRINAHDQVSGNPVALNSAPTAVTAAGTYSYALYPFGAISGNVTQATSAYLPELFSVSVAVGNSTSYTYSLGYCLLP